MSRAQSLAFQSRAKAPSPLRGRAHTASEKTGCKLRKAITNAKECSTVAAKRDRSRDNAESGPGRPTFAD